MCDQCIIRSVKRRMLSRRDILRSAPLVAAATAISLPPAQARAQTTGRVVDLTWKLDSAFPTWSGPPGIHIQPVANFADDGFNVFRLMIDEHTGTHIDAPLHFSADGLSVDEIAPENLVCPLCIIDISARAAEDPDTTVTPDDITAWTADHGDIPAGSVVAMYSGWGSKVTTDGFRNADSDGVQHYPGFHEDAARMLLEGTGAVALGVDTLSLDPGNTETFATHYAWLPSNRYGIEALANLDQLPPVGATIMVGAPVHRGGSGGPARILAMV
jgi:kynurenine formamidase